MKMLWKRIFIVLILMFLYLPILILAVYSFTDATNIGAIRGFSIHNYITLFTTPELVQMIVGTVALALGVAAIATILGTIGAIGAFYSKKRMASAIVAMNQVPVVNADVVTGFSICILLVVVLGISKDTYIPLVAGQVTLCAPFVFLSVIPKLKQMDQSIYEAALDLGASPFTALVRIVIPQIFPGILSGFALAVTLSLDDYFVATYTKPATFDTISTYVVNATKGAQTTIKTALWALSTVIFLLVILAVVIMSYRAKHASRRILSICAVILSILLGLFAVPGEVCAREPAEEVTLRVSNWEEYLDIGGWDEEETIDLDSGDIIGVNDMVDDFEEWYFETYGIKVNVEYSTFGTNEDLYNMLTLGDTFDLVCPSDYMIMKLMAEDRLVPLSDEFFDTGDSNNYYINGVSPYIKDIFEKNKIGGEAWAKYAAGYMWGITGIVYNPDKISAEEASSWTILNNPEYKRQITIKDNVRDSYFAALGALNSELLTSEEFMSDPDYEEKLQEKMNDTSPGTIAKVQEYLQDVKDNAYSFETDAGKADMITGKVVANYQWSGDGVYTMDQADEDDFTLAFVVPKEVTNIYFDGWVMLKSGIGEDAAKQHAAEAFINFTSRADNVIRNMYYTGYTSVISGNDDERIFEYADWCYGAEEDEEDVMDYNLGYFFAGDGKSDEYIITAPTDQVHRQLFAQYPDEESISRAAVMEYFDDKQNEMINQMWISVRCYNIHDVPAWAWLTSAVVVIGLVYLVIRKKWKYAGQT